jgi:hypothetical protein
VRIAEMKALVEHLPASLVIGATGWLLTGDVACLFAALLAGWMIDADHLFDLSVYLTKTRASLSLGLVLTGSYFKLNGKVFVPLHAWELSLAMALSAWLLEPALGWPLQCAALAHVAHLWKDQRSYNIRPLGYWFISRARRSFDHQGFCQ